MRPKSSEGGRGSPRPAPHSRAGVRAVLGEWGVSVDGQPAVLGEGCPLGTRQFFCFPIRTTAGYSSNQRRLALNRRRLANDQPQLHAGWRFARVRVSRRPAGFFFFKVLRTALCWAAGVRSSDGGCSVTDGGWSSTDG